ncbi:hypothetical protein [Thermoleptolyngbya sp.]
MESAPSDLRQSLPVDELTLLTWQTQTLRSPFRSDLSVNFTEIA